MSIVRHVIDAAKGKHPITKKRSPHWSTVRDAHIEKYPYCAVCGNDKHLQVHHRHPFYLHPELELDPDNLITLCEPPGRTDKCHLVFGHCFNWKLFNPEVSNDALYWNKKLKEAHERRKRYKKGVK